ncbi:NADH-ubiquinone oxidoreductase-F iron-sulfur binding region domain-containing protein [Gordonia sp. DT30]|uniref:NADH-ubiquinone oxidoreductase-F iron-sulfur binding region domain-containing protein n=1 Tax=Gordonia sp. DT30 TaxID=3416546 RepID=UPI003CEF26DB
MSALADLLTAAGLTGRGGADFPTGRKVELAEHHRADLIINACDGELDARKDGWVIAHHLDDVLAGAELLDCRRIRIAAQRDSATSRLLDRAGADSMEVPNRYVASEESALVALAHGGRARPLMRSVPVTAGARTQTGRRLRPTLVLNAETVWRIAQIADHGVRWFRSYGTHAEPGPRLVTLVNGVAHPGVHTAEAGLATTEILALGGGSTIAVQALWFGGLSGGFVAGRTAPETVWSRNGLAVHGIRPGAGTVRLIDARTDPWDDVSIALDYAAGETAGQCGPCMFGVPALAADVAGLRAGAGPDVMARMTRRVAELPGRGACRFPDGVADLLASALTVFGRPSPPAGRHHRPLPETPSPEPGFGNLPEERRTPHVAKDPARRHARV